MEETTRQPSTSHGSAGLPGTEWAPSRHVAMVRRQLLLSLMSYVEALGRSLHLRDVDSPAPVSVVQDMFPGALSDQVVT